MSSSTAPTVPAPRVSRELTLTLPVSLPQAELERRLEAHLLIARMLKV